MCVTCYHCSLPVAEADREAFSLVVDDTPAYFCCPACKAVTEMILAGGLSDYYQKREGKAEAPTESVQSDKNPFTVWDGLDSEFITRSDEQTILSLFIEGMHCTACAWLIEQYILKMPGVCEARVNFERQHLLVTYENSSQKPSTIMAGVTAIGYQPHPFQASAIQTAIRSQRKNQLKRIGITFLLMMQLGMLAAGVYAGDYLGISAHHRQLLHAFGLLFSLPLLYFSALPFFSAAVIALKQKRITMDVNITLAIIGLYGGSIVSVIQGRGDVYFDSIAMLCLFILVARFIEFSSRSALQQNKGILPQYVTRVSASGTDQCLLEQVEPGDRIRVKSGETIAFDGKVVEGFSTVSEAVLTGEAKAVKKQSGDEVFASSTNHDGQLLIAVSRGAGHNLIDRMEKLATATGDDPDTEDNYSLLFTTIIALIALGTFIGWQWVNPEQAFWVALSVLVISCPCALSLAAPTARAAMQFRLRQQGVLIKNADVLNAAKGITEVMLDKTGTLTDGEFSLVDCETFSCEKEQAIRIAASLEQVSNHPIARAFNGRGFSPVEQAKLFQGQGVEGTIDGVRYRLGSESFCRAWANIPGVFPELDNKELIPVWLCSESGFLCRFSLMDNLRKDVDETVNQLLGRGIHCQILSGDHSSSVEVIARRWSIPFDKGLTGEEKMAVIHERQQAGAKVMMMGDGVNDMPGFGSSHLSLTLNTASDWVKNKTDVVLLNNRLSDTLKLLDGAKDFARIHKLNLIWAIGYNLVAIPFAVAGWVTPLFAALGMSLSSVLVVLNSRRLLKCKASTS